MVSRQKSNRINSPNKIHGRLVGCIYSLTSPLGESALLGSTDAMGNEDCPWFLCNGYASCEQQEVNKQPQDVKIYICVMHTVRDDR